MAFSEPETLATFDRSFGDKHERLVLEKSEYRGKPTYCLRLLWQTPDGSWRWSPAKPTQSGKCWASLSVKGRELLELGEALIAEAKASGVERVTSPRVKDTPQRAAERAKFDERPKFRGNDDDLPF